MGFDDASRAAAPRLGGAPITERPGCPAVDAWVHVAELSTSARAHVMPSIADRPLAGGPTRRRRPARRRRTRDRFFMRLGAPDWCITFQNTPRAGPQPLGAPRSTESWARPGRNTGRTPPQNIWWKSETRRAESRLNALYLHCLSHRVPDICWRSVERDGTVAASIAFAVAGGRVVPPTTDLVLDDGWPQGVTLGRAGVSTVGDHLAVPVFGWADAGV